MPTLTLTTGKNLCTCGREKDATDALCLLCSELSYEAQERDDDNEVDPVDNCY